MNHDEIEDKKEYSRLGKAAKPKFFYGYVVTAAGFIIWLTGFGSYNTFGIFLKPVLTEFGSTRAEIALALSMLTVMQAILAIAMGWLTDKLGARIVVMVFGSFSGIAYLLMSQVNTLWQFQMNYALVASIGMSTLVVPVMATVARWFVKRRGLMTGIVQAGTGPGGLIIAPLTGWLILTYGWRYSYIILGIILLVGIVTAGLFLKRAPENTGHLPDGENAVTALGVNESSPNLHQAGLSLREATRTSQFWMIAALYSSFGFCRAIINTHIAAHAQDLGFSLVDGANVLAALVGASIVGRIGMGRVADIIGNRRAFVISYVITTAILVWGLVARDLWELYLFGIVFGFGWGAQAVLRHAITSEVFGLVSLAVVMAVLGIAEASASAFGAYFAGYIFDIAGSYQPTFLMGVAASTTGILLTWLLKPSIRKSK